MGSSQASPRPHEPGYLVVYGGTRHRLDAVCQWEPAVRSRFRSFLRWFQDFTLVYSFLASEETVPVVSVCSSPNILSLSISEW